MSSLFAYGTLMCEDIMADVSGLRPPAAAGTLRGYRRLRVRGEPYPALVPVPRGVVEGVVYRDILPEAWERLDRFEGELYSRETVQVELSGGEPMAAQAYVAKAAFRDRLDAAEWDFAEFLRRGKARFQRSYGGYESL